MKTLKAICPAAVLALALSVSTYAGDVQTPGSPIPPPHSNSTGIGSTPTAKSTTDDLCTSGLVDILLALTSIF
jgi:hypothetical protein